MLKGDDIVTPIEMSIALEKTLLDQAAIVAHRLSISQSALFELAMERFLSDYPDQTEAEQTAKADRVINQGDVYWLPSQEGISHPHVVVQENVFNHSRIHTVVVCALTSNPKKISIPGNVLLDVGEASLSRQSVVEVSKVLSIDKTQLGDYIGSLSESRINQILAGMRFLLLNFR